MMRDFVEERCEDKLIEEVDEDDNDVSQHHSHCVLCFVLWVFSIM